ncbi:trypsin-like serine protease [Martensiomyces pterosporus]|nr:trypsin-like serine protease [Martensiomyces pterosporus]
MKASLALTALLASAALANPLQPKVYKRIIGGGDASYSFTASILKTDGKTGGVCTGAFISDTVLLVSATCVSDISNDKALPAASLLVGRSSDIGGALQAINNGTSLASIAGNSAGSLVVPTQVLLHPGYNSRAHADNVAMLFLGQPIKSASPVLIQKKLPSEGARLTATGYGASSSASDAQPAKNLKKALVQVGKSSECTDAWASFKNAKNIVCVQPVSGKDGNACSGDGLLIQEDSNNVALLGVLNLYASKDNADSAQCDDKGVFNYYTAVENYLAWITQKSPLTEDKIVSNATIATTGVAPSAKPSESAEHSESASASHESESMDHPESASSKSKNAASGRSTSAMAASVAVVAMAALF